MSLFEIGISLCKRLRVKIMFIKMVAYSDIEWAYIHYIYRRTNGNCRKAQRLYRKIFHKYVLL